MIVGTFSRQGAIALALLALLPVRAFSQQTAAVSANATVPQPKAIERDEAWDRLAVLELSEAADTASEWFSELSAAGGCVRVAVENLVWVDLPFDADGAVASDQKVLRIHRDAWAGPYSSVIEKSASTLLGSYRSGEAFVRPRPLRRDTVGDALSGFDAERGGGEQPSASVCMGWNYNQWPPTSDTLLGRTHIMQGRVAANFFLVESDADGPENVFDWDSSEISLASSEIQEALVWWSWLAGMFGHQLSFTLNLHLPGNYECQAPGEASLHESWWLWDNVVPVIMQRLGFEGPGFCACGRFNEATIGDADRAFAAFIFDGNNYFVDYPTFAYAFLNGPYLVSLRRPDQWGTNYLNLVLQHEIGHIFRACDEYYPACTTCNPCVDGAAINGNCEGDVCQANQGCIMRHNDDECCEWTRRQTGLLDNYGTPALVSPAGGEVLASGEATLELTDVFGVPRYQFLVRNGGTTFFSAISSANNVQTWALPEGGTYQWLARSLDSLINASPFSTPETFRVDYPAFVAPTEAVILTAPDLQSPTWIRLFRANGKPGPTSFLAFDGSTDGAQVAAGDMDGDGDDELLVTPGEVQPNFGLVRIFRPNTDFVSDLSLYSYDVESLELAAGDLDGDGTDEIVSVPSRLAHPSADPFVRVSRADGSLIQDLVPFQSSHAKLTMACGDVDGDGADDVLAARSADGNDPRVVRILRLDGTLLAEIDAFPGETRGLMLAAADVDGDGAEEVIASPGRNESQANRVRVFRLDGTLLIEFVGHPEDHNALTLAGGDTDGDSLDEVLTGSRPGNGSEVRIWSGSGSLESQFTAYAPLGGNGVHLAVIRFRRGLGHAR